MNLLAITTELGDKLKTIDGLRVSDFPSGGIHVPAAVVTLPERVDYDADMDQGADDLQLDVVVIVDGVSDRLVVSKLSDYVSRDGASSVKNALETGPNTAFDFAHVRAVEFEPFKYNDMEYTAAIFEVTITASKEVP